MTNKKHAPLWYAKHTSSEQGLVIEESTGKTIAVTYEENDSDFIVKACNNHCKLKQLAIECLQWFRAYDKEIDPSRAWHYKELKKQINQAIQDCEG